MSDTENKTETPEPFPFQDQSDREWRTWRQVCKQLEKHGIVVNDPKSNALVLAIKLWGEEQVALTMEAEAPRNGEHARSLADLRQKYAAHVIDGWDL